VSYNFCPWCGEPIDKENFVDPYRAAILKGIEDANNVRFPSGKLKNGQKTIIDNLKRELDRWDTKGEFSSISDCLKAAYITEDQNEFFRSRKLHEEMQHEKWKRKEKEKARRREERERNKRESACS
jgi:hypothetical protein